MFKDALSGHLFCDDQIVWAGKNVNVWLLPFLDAYIHKAWSEITAQLEWAMMYISQSATLRTYK